MSIKPIKEVPKTEKQGKMGALMDDIREIIDKRIPLCEITTQYAQSSMRERLRKAIRNVCWEIAQEKGLQYHMSALCNVFNVGSWKENNITHWYIEFNAKNWDLIMSQEKTETEED